MTIKWDFRVVSDHTFNSLFKYGSNIGTYHFKAGKCLNNNKKITARFSSPRVDIFKWNNAATFKTK